ncbi:hypothetical protein TA3x_001478 [Tundrisphaera sp. TA3]|uniref:hypothetical protein n=1 Tax=Tundrisphaera sp. TA3 TaxID=3435775 RepID=UPI003EC0A1B2
MHRRTGLLAMVFCAAIAPVRAEAQAIYGGYTAQYRLDGVKDGSTFGTSWGVASYGSRRTYSEFSSPYGAGYGYGYKPTTFAPGPFGIGLWRPGAGEGSVYGAPNSYRTFPYPYAPGPVRYGPPIGVYAPGFGPDLPPG